MKNSTLILAAVLSASAAADGSALVVRTASRENIVVSLDGAPYEGPSGSVEFRDIQPGQHNIKISRLEYPVTGNYRPSCFPIRKELYRGTLYVPAGTLLTTEVSRRQLSIASCEALDACLSLPCRPEAMQDATFHRLLSSMASKNFESSKLRVAQQALSSRYVTSAQVEEILRAFAFESTRLEFARSAWNRTVDPENYFLVNDAFDFESSIGELQEYIDTQQLQAWMEPAGR